MMFTKDEIKDSCLYMITRIDTPPRYTKLGRWERGFEVKTIGAMPGITYPKKGEPCEIVVFRQELFCWN